MNLLPFFKLVKVNTSLYSPLYDTVKFKCIRKFNPMQKESPQIIECETLCGNVVLFTHEGKPIVFHPTGEMIYETSMGQCMLFLSKEFTDWEYIFNETELNKKTED